jgi:hypothetical protein
MSSTLLSKALHAVARAPLVAAPRAFSGVVAGASFKLPELPYDPAALEPFISGEIMRVRRALRAPRAARRSHRRSLSTPPRRSTTASTTTRT